MDSHHLSNQKYLQRFRRSKLNDLKYKLTYQELLQQSLELGHPYALIKYLGKLLYLQNPLFYLVNNLNHLNLPQFQELLQFH